MLGEDKLSLFACLGGLLVDWFNFKLTVLAIFLFASVQQHFFSGIFYFVQIEIYWSLSEHNLLMADYSPQAHKTNSSRSPCSHSPLSTLCKWFCGFELNFFRTRDNRAWGNRTGNNQTLQRSARQ